MSIGRNDEINANEWLEWSIKILEKNLTATGEEQYTSVLEEFKNHNMDPINSWWDGSFNRCKNTHQKKY